MERDRNQVLVTIFEPLNQARLKVGFNFQIVKSNEPMNSLYLQASLGLDSCTCN